MLNGFMDDFYDCFSLFYEFRALYRSVSLFVMKFSTGTRDYITREVVI